MPINNKYQYMFLINVLNAWMKRQFMLIDLISVNNLDLR